MKKNKSKQHRFSLPENLLLQMPMIHITGNALVFIDNHTGIYEYYHDRICVNSKIGLILVLGKDMVIEEIAQDEILIRGMIQSVKMEDSL